MNVVRGSTLLETLVALILITISFSIGVRTFLHVTNSTQTGVIIQSYWYTEAYFKQWEVSNGSIPMNITLKEGETLEAQKSTYGYNTNLIQLTVFVKNNNNKVIYTRTKIIPFSYE